MQRDEPVTQEDVARLTVEVERVKAEVERLTGLRSRWSGVVRVIESREAHGRKEWDCAISLNRVIMQSDWGFAVQLHELLHSASVGVTEQDMMTWRGLEEGLVELLERELVPDVAGALGVVPAHAPDSYPGYTSALTTVIEMTGLSLRDACLELLRTPLAEREWHVQGMILRAHPTEHMGWVYRRSESHLGVLRTVIP